MYYRIKQYLWDLLINKFLMSYMVPLSIRVLILNAMGCKIRGAMHAKCIVCRCPC